MKPSSLSWLLSVKSTANQMNVASTSPCLAMSPRVITPVARSAPRPRNAIAVESRPSVAAERPERHHAEEDHQHDPLLARKRTERGERLPGRGRSLRRAAHLGPDDAIQHERQDGHRAERRHARGEEPSPEPDLDAEPAGHLRAERVGGHRRQPERRRHAQAGDAREHQERADPPAIRLDRASRPPRSPASTPAGRARRTVPCCSGNAGAITASSRKIEYERPRVDRPNRLTIQCPLRAPSPHFTTDAGHQKGHDDEEDGAVAKAGIRVGRLEQAGEHRDGNGQDRSREDRQGADDDGEDRAGEQGEQAPRLNAQPLRRRGPPQPARSRPR